MNVAISRKRPGLLYALAVTLPFTAQAEETVVVTATPPASASAPTEGYSARTSLGATKTDQPLITTAQSVSVVTRQQMADQGANTISQALEYTPGVYSSFGGGATRFDAISLRGYHGGDVDNKASDIVELEGRIFIPPYDDPQVIAGQGTIGLEILEDLYDVDNVIVPIGGGGLIAGIAIAIKSINPTIRIIGVQSENVHGMAASWYAGEITSHRHAGTLADGCDVARPGKLTYEIARQLVDDIVLVSEDDIRQSMVALIQRNKVITEGAGALACAALLSGKLDSYIQNRKTVSLISGGNIDLSRVSQITGFVDA